jgi:2OG-Fe(II) oxygenase superfamily
MTIQIEANFRPFMRQRGSGAEQSVFGNENSDESDLRILTANKVHAQHILDLAEDRLLAVRIPNYSAPDVCKAIATQIDVDPHLAPYQNAAIDRLGRAFFETVGAGTEQIDAYFSGAIDRMDYIRSIFGAHPSPLDRFCRELDEKWQHGATTLCLTGRKMNVGLFRNFRAGSEAEPHQDDLVTDAPYGGPGVGIVNQIAFNVYLRTSTTGGELELWDTRLSRDEYERRRIPSSYGLNRSLISDPAAVLHPRSGEMILFNSSKIHAVRSIEGESRITITCFVGYRGRDRSLVMWS